MQVCELGDAFAVQKMLDAKLAMFRPQGFAMVDEGCHDRIVQAAGQPMNPPGERAAMNAGQSGNLSKADRPLLDERQEHLVGIIQESDAIKQPRG
jgi:hypothetical protein